MSVQKIEQLIEGISFSRFSMADVFLVINLKDTKKKIKLISCGDLINRDYLNRFINNSSNIELENVADIKHIETYLNIFKKLEQSYSSSNREEVKIQARENIMKWINSIYSGGNNFSLIDLVIICEKAFYDIDKKTEEFLIEENLCLYERAMIFSSLAVVMAIISGYIDYKFLKDFYNISYFLCFSMKSFWKIDNHNLLDRLRVESSDNIINVVGDVKLKNILEEIDSLSTKFPYSANNKNLFRLSSMLFECVDGSGLPKQVSFNEISDLEAIVIFLNHSVAFKKWKYSLNDGKEFFKSIFELNNKMKRRFLTNRLDNSLERALRDVV